MKENIKKVFFRQPNILFRFMFLISFARASCEVRVWGVSSKSEWYCTFIVAVLCVISCYNGSCYNETRLYSFPLQVSSCQDIAIIPGDGVAVSDGAARAVKLFDDQGVFESALVTKVRPLGVTCSRSGLVAYVNQSGWKQYSINLHMLDGQEVRCYLA